jgi:hypothetical protein
LNYATRSIYYGANGHWYRDLGGPGSQKCINLNIAGDQTLRISATGFECDLSCGEKWDDTFEEANDKIGTILQVFDPTTNFGLGKSFTVYSQPVIGVSERADRDTRFDYRFSFGIYPR